MFQYLWDLRWDKIEGISITLTLLVVLRTYLRSKKIERMDFYFRIKKDFYSEKSVLFSDSVWEHTIFMDEFNGRPYLRYTKQDGIVETLELDLLDNLEDLNLFYNDGLISMKLLYEGFGTIIVNVGNNNIVEGFINRLREVDGDNEYYTGVSILFKKVEKYRRNKDKILYKIYYNIISI